MSTMAHVFNNLCSDESMPDCITIHKNGTKTVLMKNTYENGEVYYTGTPSFKDRNGRQRVGEHSLVLSADGRIEGTYALNSIVVGGWIAKVSKDPGEEERQKIRELLQSTLVTYAVLAQQGKDSDETSLEEAIRQETGYDVVRKEMGEEDLALMAAMEFKSHLVELLQRRGWSLNIVPRNLVKKLGGYCDVVKGDWTSEASKIATTSALPYSTTACLKSLGLTLKKVKRSSRKRTVNQEQ